MTDHEVPPRVGAGCRCARTGRPPGPSARRPRGRRGTGPEPGTMMSGGMPSKAARRHRPALTASSTRRRTRPREKRSRPCQSRRHTGWRLAGPRCIQGRLRGRSWASWRRSTSTVRRSCSVTAKRSWPTRAVRRSASSSDTRPSSVKPATANADRADRAGQVDPVDLSGQRARLPRVVVGAGTTWNRSRAAQSMTSAASSVAIHRRKPMPEATMAAPMNSAPIRAPGRGPGHRPGPQRPAQPSTGELAGDGADDGAQEGGVPQRAPGPAEERLATVDRGQQDEADLGSFQGERSAATARAQAEPEGEGRHEPDRGRSVAADVGHGGSVDGVVTEPGRQEQRDEDAEDAGQVGAVGRLEPVELFDRDAGERVARAALASLRAPTESGVGHGSKLPVGAGRRAGGPGRPTSPTRTARTADPAGGRPPRGPAGWRRPRRPSRSRRRPV